MQIMGKSADVDEDVNRRAGLALRQPAKIRKNSALPRSVVTILVVTHFEIPALRFRLLNSGPSDRIILHQEG